MTQSPQDVHWKDEEGKEGRKEQGRFEVDHSQEPGHGLRWLEGWKEEWKGSECGAGVSKTTTR